MLNVRDPIEVTVYAAHGAVDERVIGCRIPARGKELAAEHAVAAPVVKVTYFEDMIRERRGQHLRVRARARVQVIGIDDLVIVVVDAPGELFDGPPMQFGRKTKPAL